MTIKITRDEAYTLRDSLTDAIGFARTASEAECRIADRAELDAAMDQKGDVVTLEGEIEDSARYFGCEGLDD